MCAEKCVKYRTFKVVAIAASDGATIVSICGKCDRNTIIGLNLRSQRV